MAEHNCPNGEKNKMRCTCPHSNCARHGICCECVAYHLPQQQLPQCYVRAGIKG